MKPNKNPSYTSLLHVCISLLHVMYQVKIRSFFFMKFPDLFEKRVKFHATPWAVVLCTIALQRYTIVHHVTQIR